MPIWKLLTQTHDVSYNGLDDRVQSVILWNNIFCSCWDNTLTRYLFFHWMLRRKKIIHNRWFLFHFFCLVCRVETKGRVFEIKWVPSLFNSDNNKALLRGNNISPREAHGRNEFSKISLKESKKYWYCCMIIMKMIMIFARIIIIDYFNVSKLHVLWVWSDNL